MLAAFGRSLTLQIFENITFIARMSRRKKNLHTLQDVIDKLGGVSELARLTETYPPTICYWRDKRKSIPARYSPFINDELAKRGFRADDSLFDFFNGNGVTRDENARAA